jgi:hypothetical protein
VLKKTITYEDLDGNSVTEDFYFNLSKAELAEMVLVHKGDLSEYLKRIIKDEDGTAIIASFKDILSKAYGKRSDDGRRFIKSPELWEEFSQTDAYSKLFMELITDAEAASAFINAVVPKNIETAPNAMTQVNLETPPKDEVAGMTREELEEAFKKFRAQKS